MHIEQNRRIHLKKKNRYAEYVIEFMHVRPLIDEDDGDPTITNHTEINLYTSKTNKNYQEGRNCNYQRMRSYLNK